MNQPIKRTVLPAAIDNFAELVSYKDPAGAGYLFVDKSLFIKEVAYSGAKVTLITRPRRFGKTLALSMLEHFFAAEVNGVKTKGLFHGLAVSNYPAVMAMQGQYPAICLSLKEVDGDTFEEMLSSLQEQMEDLFTRHRSLLDGGHLTPGETKLFKQILDRKASTAQYQGALKWLSRLLQQATGKKVMIFVDEYDAPMQNAYVNGYYEQCKKFMGHFLGSAFKGNLSLEKGLLTGVLKVAQAGLYSKFNNPTIDTVINPEGGYAPYFGFTEAETDALLDAAALPKRAHELKQMYNRPIAKVLKT